MLLIDAQANGSEVSELPRCLEELARKQCLFNILVTLYNFNLNTAPSRCLQLRNGERESMMVGRLYLIQWKDLWNEPRDQNHAASRIRLTWGGISATMNKNNSSAENEEGISIMTKTTIKPKSLKRNRTSSLRLSSVFSTAMACRERCVLILLAMRSISFRVVKEAHTTNSRYSKVYKFMKFRYLFWDEGRVIDVTKPEADERNIVQKTPESIGVVETFQTG
ncbi:hypothetical protein Bca101_080662 [Brassica carinata]